MLGIDIYERYQQLYDPAAVKAHGVEFAWVKGSEGAGEREASAARRLARAGIVTGVYHYAKMNVATGEQADLLLRQHNRYECRLPPALDIEGEWEGHPKIAVAFCNQFFDALRRKGQQWVAIYSNAAFLKTLLGSLAPDDRRLVWAARYGQNDGRIYPPPFPCDVHQYTDLGLVPGIHGNVDLNLAVRPERLWRSVTMTPEQEAMLRDIHEQLCGSGGRGPGQYPGWAPWTYGPARQKLTLVDLVRECHRELVSRLDLKGRPGPEQDTLFGQVLSTRANLAPNHPPEKP